MEQQDLERLFKETLEKPSTPSSFSDRPVELARTARFRGGPARCDEHETREREYQTDPDIHMAHGCPPSCGRHSDRAHAAGALILPKKVYIGVCKLCLELSVLEKFNLP
jgi:hypothetical protein